jgi:copper resistance protein B
MSAFTVCPVVALVMGLAVTADRADAQSSSTAPSRTDRHAGHTQQAQVQQTPPASETAEHDRHQPPDGDKPSQELPPFVPPVTDEDRKAAFPDVEGHAVHDQAIHYFVLLDRLEWQIVSEGAGFDVDSTGWLGRDRDRVWFRAEGDGEDGRLGEAQAHVLYGRQISRWWDFVAGIRQDFRPGPAQTWAAVGVQGLAPYWFEIEATAYVGESGRTHARFEVEYDLLLTNRLIVQPLVEVEVFGKSDPERGTGAGLSTTGAGVRLRYELRREIAPYVGVVWTNTWGTTADFAEAAGEDTGGARLVTGLRLWF